MPIESESEDGDEGLNDPVFGRPQLYPIKACPDPSELPSLRKGLRKRKPPHIEGGMKAGIGSIGGFVIEQIEGGHRIEWQLCGQEKKSATFSELCSSHGKELERLEVGWLIANLVEQEALQIMDSIGGPKEAMSYTAPLWKIEIAWRHWALVPAGFMISATTKKAAR